MLFRPGPLITDAAGSVGGLTVQRSPDGLIGRSRPQPTRRATRATAGVRDRTQQLARRWRALTQEQRDAWEAFSASITWYNRFGDEVAGNGYRAYLRRNSGAFTNADQVAIYAVDDDPPSETIIVLPAAPSLVYDEGGPDLLFASANSSVDGNMWIAVFASPPRSAGRSYDHRAMPWLISLPPDAALPYDLTDVYKAVHGRLPNPDANETAFVRIYARNATSGWPGASTQLRMVIQ